MNSVTIRLVPPKLMNGSGRPLVGRRPVTTPMLIAACKLIRIVMPNAIRRPPASDARPLNNEIWLDERMRRQQNVLNLVKKVQQEKLGKDATVALINTLVKDSFERLEHSERKAFFDAYQDSTAQMVLTVIKIATPAQKAHAVKRMQGWIDDFNSLATQAK